MRHLSPYAIALLASCAAFNAHAADDPGDSCSLLDWQDLQSLDVVKDTPLSDDGWHEQETPKEIPDGKLFSDICSIEIKSKEGRTSVTLSIDSFKGKVTEQQISKWLKSVAATETGQQDVALVKVGEAACESGQYDLLTGPDAKSAVNVVEHYIACDQQVGTQHISLNINVPEGKKGELPSPEQAKALLDKSITRMKHHSFAASGKQV